MFPFLALILELLSAVCPHIAADTFVNCLYQTAAAKRIEVGNLNDRSDGGQRAMPDRNGHMTHPGAVTQRHLHRPLAFLMMASDND